MKRQRALDTLPKPNPCASRKIDPPTAINFLKISSRSGKESIPDSIGKSPTLYRLVAHTPLPPIARLNPEVQFHWCQVGNIAKKPHKSNLVVTLASESSGLKKGVNGPPLVIPKITKEKMP